MRLARWGACFGLFCGVLYSFGGLVLDVLTTGPNWGTAMAFMALVGMPVLFAAFGFFAGAVIALATRGVGALRHR